MSPLQSGKGHLVTDAIVRRGLFLIFEMGRYIDSPGTSHVQFAFVFRVEIDQNTALEHIAPQLVGSGQPRLLVHRKEALQSRVRNIFPFEDRQHRADAHPVVGSERRPAGFDPLTVHVGLDRIGFEIEFQVAVLLGHHIHMRLQNDRRMSFVARRGRFAHDYVADRILPVFQTVLLGKTDHILPDLFLVFRRVRNRTDFGELLPQSLRLQFGNLFHRYIRILR